MQVGEFWQNLTVGDPSECWTWTRAANEKGYGVVYVDGVRWKTHRFAWFATFGPIPAGLMVLHNCDNPPCCNPDHLRLGTNADNVRDMITKGRNSPPPNNAGWNKKDIPEDLLGTIPDYKLAKQIGVDRTVIMRRRQRLKIQSYAERTGQTGRFQRREVK